MITICLTYFRSLALANLAAALYSVSRQDLSCVEAIIVVDNNTDDPAQDVHDVVSGLNFPVPVHVFPFKHGDASKTHAWSTNVAVSWAFTPWIFFTRADYVLDFDIVGRFVEVAGAKPAAWRGFLTSDFCHLHVPIADVERTNWRIAGVGALAALPGRREEYGIIDSGVWMTRKESFGRGLDEDLTAWGHAQTHFQHGLYLKGVEFVKIPEVLFYHPHHGAPRDIDLAHEQLRAKGMEPRDLWQRYDGVSPYV